MYISRLCCSSLLNGAKRVKAQNETELKAIWQIVKLVTRKFHRVCIAGMIMSSISIMFRCIQLGGFVRMTSSFAELADWLSICETNFAASYSSIGSQILISFLTAFLQWKPLVRMTPLLLSSNYLTPFIRLCTWSCNLFAISCTNRRQIYTLM